jgi:alkanesulfonate monooxygenase SsuD/methylene tetrahydromethanopterin reductase-like flavin-dependent oxidoreductase (luciferase family)
MQLGVYVPQFASGVQTSLRIARLAEVSGLDGVFVFDHLFPPGSQDAAKNKSGYAHNAIALLAAIAAQTDRIKVGTLVLRVGVIPDALLYAQLMTVQELSGGRLIAGLGVGDALSARDNRELGLPVPPRSERIEHLMALAQRLTDAGVEVWLGGRSEAIREAAQTLGVRVNLWTPELSEIRPGDTWGGIVNDAGENLSLIDRAEAEWAVALVRDLAGDPQMRLETIRRAVAV